MAFIRVSTSYTIYKIEDAKTFACSLIKECKTKGEAVEWIHKEGDKGAFYHILEVHQK